MCVCVTGDEGFGGCGDMRRSGFLGQVREELRDSEETQVQLCLWLPVVLTQTVTHTYESALTEREGERESERVRGM